MIPFQSLTTRAYPESVIHSVYFSRPRPKVPTRLNQLHNQIDSIGTSASTLSSQPTCLCLAQTSARTDPVIIYPSHSSLCTSINTNHQPQKPTRSALVRCTRAPLHLSFTDSIPQELCYTFTELSATLEIHACSNSSIWQLLARRVTPSCQQVSQTRPLPVRNHNLRILVSCSIDDSPPSTTKSADFCLDYGR